MPSILQTGRSYQLNGNALKLIAAVTMLIDHMGLMFFPQHMIFRVIGRLSFPIYAFMIAEGCHYTKNRLRYFLNVFLLGAACQVVYFVFANDTTINILLTFSCSIPIIYLLQDWKATAQHWRMIPFGAAIGLVYVLSKHILFLYEFWGIMIPVFVALSYPPRNAKRNTEHRYCSVALLGLGLLLLCADSHPLQYYSLLALPILLLYSGNRGKGNFKYVFYLFYPLHLAALQAIAWLLG